MTAHAAGNFDNVENGAGEHRGFGGDREAEQQGLAQHAGKLSDLQRHTKHPAIARRFGGYGDDIPADSKFMHDESCLMSHA